MSGRLLSGASRLALLLLLAALSSGCAGQAKSPPGQLPQVRVPTILPVSPDVDKLATSKTPALVEQSARQRAEELTVRVRNIACQLSQSGTGSGFALDSHTLVTNRHVIAGGEQITVDTWDGRVLKVKTAKVGRLGDLGVATVAGFLPASARFGPRPPLGAVVEAVGYPLGGALKITRGRVIGGYYDSSLPGRVILTSAPADHGNSGGPLLDAKGRVVGIVYKGVPGKYTLAIPIALMRSLVKRSGLESLARC